MVDGFKNSKIIDLWGLSLLNLFTASGQVTLIGVERLTVLFVLLKERYEVVHLERTAKGSNAMAIPTIH